MHAYVMIFVMFSIVHFLLLKVCDIIILNTPLCLLNVLQCVKIVLIYFTNYNIKKLYLCCCVLLICLLVLTLTYIVHSPSNYPIA